MIQADPPIVTFADTEEVNWRWELDVSYDGQTTTITYTTYRDDEVYLINTVDHPGTDPFNVLGANSQAAAAAQQDCEAVGNCSTQAAIDNDDDGTTWDTSTLGTMGENDWEDSNGFGVG